MRSTSSRLIIAAVVFSIVAAACTPASKVGDTPSGTPETTSSSTSSTSSTTPRTDDDGNLLPPSRGDAAEVAAGVLVSIDGFEAIDDPPQHANDLVFAMETWMPEEFVAGTAGAVYDYDSGAPVAVVSIIPSLSFRGDPDLVPSLIQALTGSQAASPVEGIYTAFTSSGLEMQMWSTGDGFVAAAAPDDASAIAYLVALQDRYEPNDVWPAGSCLYLEDGEDLPYAPFPSDIVVSCDGAHNFEVLLAQKIGTDLERYDEDAITLQRNYECDRVYTERFGSQRTQAPGLVTYMPDEAEWDRGDRYLACVVSIERNDGHQLVAGPMSDLGDLTWEPEVGDCLLAGLPADTVSCKVAHAYQYLGDVDVAVEAWPEPGDNAFSDACLPLLDGLSSGPAELEVFPVGLGAYAFEQGDRTVQCMAFASVDGFLVDATGSFDGRWSILSGGGIPA